MSQEASSTNAGIIDAQGNYDEHEIRKYVQYFILPRFKDLHEEDSVILLSILLRIEKIQLPISFEKAAAGSYYERLDSYCNWEYYFEDCKDSETSPAKRRITKCIVELERPIEWMLAMQLIERLDKLEDLTLQCTYSLPLTEIISRLPNLKRLQHFWDDCEFPIEDRTVDIGPLSLLSGKGPSNLEILVLENYTIQEHHLESFLFCLLPFLPKLLTFSVTDNDFDGLRQLGQKIQDSIKSNELPRSRLRKLDLGSGFWRSREENASAAEILLLAFPELVDLRLLPYDYWWDCHNSGTFHVAAMEARIRSRLDINRARRVLVEVAGAHSATTSLPLSVWPIILKRTDERTDGRPDGIYYLLQNVPALREGGDKRDCNHHNQPKRRRLV